LAKACITHWPCLRKSASCSITFIGVPVQAYTRAMLGVYELARVELLRDIYLWAYERSPQEYLAIRQELAEPDPLRMQYRELIRKIIREIVQKPDGNTLDIVSLALKKEVKSVDRDNISALVIDELRRLHEGVLARYGLKPSEFVAWRDHSQKHSDRKQ